jgi:hypothetical protein
MMKSTAMPISFLHEIVDLAMRRSTYDGKLKEIGTQKIASRF